jgi:hypothetical protein
MNPRILGSQRVIDLVRSDVRVVPVLADLGISPRYLYWTLASAAADAGANLDRLAARLTAVLRPSQPVTS